MGFQDPAEQGDLWGPRVDPPPLSLVPVPKHLLYLYRKIDREVGSLGSKAWNRLQIC